MPFVRSLVLLATATALCACQAPPPDAVCDHALDLIQKQAPSAFDEQGLKAMREECIEESKKDQAADGEAYAKKARCFMAAQTMADAIACDPKPAQQAAADEPAKSVQ